MAGKWSSEWFPQMEAALRQLTDQHRELEDEPLHLALAYLPRRNGQESQQDIFLFEVIGGVADRAGADGDLFEVAFDAVSGMPTGFDRTLHLILTTPRELEGALRQQAPLAMEIADAVRREDYQVLYQDSQGQRAFQHIRKAARPRRRAARG